MSECKHCGTDSDAVEHEIERLDAQIKQLRAIKPKNLSDAELDEIFKHSQSESKIGEQMRWYGRACIKAAFGGEVE